MIAQNISFLNEIGFTKIQINIYEYLLKNKFGTINDIKNELNYSYTQVYSNLLYLEKKNLIESSTESKPKLFIRRNPKISLTELLNTRFNDINENIKNLDENLKIQESKYGRCVKDVSFYHYSDTLLGVNNLSELIENSKNEIIFTSLPPSLLKRLEQYLYDAYLRGISIKMYFSLADFESMPNYFEEITNILRRIRIEITQTEQKTCRVIRYNDEIVNMGNVFIDDVYLNSIVFQEDKIFHFDGLIEPNVVKNAKQYLEPPVKTVIKRITVEYPKPIQNILNIIRENESIKTRDLSSMTKLGGAKLREILEFLINQGIVEETSIKEGKSGRPKRVYSLIEKNISS
ncbi:MAG: helix-turn-helix domain-containing protein [Promethearchaeota archaeon]|jgi:sugar-specific transcriptional regulator TrmB